MVEDLSYEQLYGMDTSGFIHLPSVLTAAELTDARRSVVAGSPADAAAGLLSHPVLQKCLDRLCGGKGSEAFREQSPVPANLNVDTDPVGWRLDTVPRFATASPACRGSSGGGRFLHDGGGSGNASSQRLRYSSSHGVMLCQGVTTLWALDIAEVEGMPSLTVIPASHRSCLPTPVSVLSGEQLGEVGTAVGLVLQPGDLLLLATTTLWRFESPSSRLLLCDYTRKDIFPSGGYTPPAADQSTKWLEELTPAARAIVAPRLVGTAPAVNPSYSPKAVEPQAPCWAAGAAPEESAGLTPWQRWEWDLNGFLVLRGVMDAEWLAEANAAVDACSEQAIEIVDIALSHFTTAAAESKEVWPERTSALLKGGGGKHRMLRGLTELPAPHCQPFRRMIAHPRVVACLETLIGQGYHESAAPYMPLWEQGTSGFSMHGQRYAAAPHSLYGLGQPAAQVNVSWQLSTVPKGSQRGFCAIPGTSSL